MSKRIVILGAGYAGLEAAKTLHKKLKRQTTWRSCIDQNESSTLLTGAQVAGSRVEPGGVQVSVRHPSTQGKFVQDKSRGQILEQSSILTKVNMSLILIAGFGSSPYFGIPALNAFTYGLLMMPKMHNHIIDMFRTSGKNERPKGTRPLQWAAEVLPA